MHFYRLNNPGHGRGGWLEVTEFSTRGGLIMISLLIIDYIHATPFFHHVTTSLTESVDDARALLGVSGDSKSFV